MLSTAATLVPVPGVQSVPAAAGSHIAPARRRRGRHAMNPPATSRVLVIVLLSLAMAACGAGEAGAESGAKLALKVSDEATAADVGLPAYPGAKPYVDSDHSGAANLGLATPLFGFKVVVTSLQTQDAPERVAAFYRKALAKYGKVLDCSDAGTASIEIKAGSEEDD